MASSALCQRSTSVDSAHLSSRQRPAHQSKHLAIWAEAILWTNALSSQSMKNSCTSPFSTTSMMLKVSCLKAMPALSTSTGPMAWSLARDCGLVAALSVSVCGKAMVAFLCSHSKSQSCITRATAQLRLSCWMHSPLICKSRLSLDQNKLNRSLTKTTIWSSYMDRTVEAMKSPSIRTCLS